MRFYFWFKDRPGRLSSATAHTWGGPLRGRIARKSSASFCGEKIYCHSRGATALLHRHFILRKPPVFADYLPRSSPHARLIANSGRMNQGNVAVDKAYGSKMTRFSPQDSTTFMLEDSYVALLLLDAVLPRPWSVSARGDQVGTTDAATATAPSWEKMSHLHSSAECIHFISANLQSGRRR